MLNTTAPSERALEPRVHAHNSNIYWLEEQGNRRGVPTAFHNLSQCNSSIVSADGENTLPKMIHDWWCGRSTTVHYKKTLERMSVKQYIWSGPESAINGHIQPSLPLERPIAQSPGQTHLSTIHNSYKLVCNPCRLNP